MGDMFRWINAPTPDGTLAGADWADASHWLDLTSGASPASRPPAAADAASFDNGNAQVALLAPTAANTLTVQNGARVSLFNGPDYLASERSSFQQSLALRELQLGSGAAGDTGGLFVAPHVTVQVADRIIMHAGSSLSLQPNNPEGITVGDDSHQPLVEVYIGRDGLLQGAGAIGAALIVDGLVEVNGGTLGVGGGVVYGGIGGTGTVVVEPDAALRLQSRYHNPSAGQIGTLILEPGGGLDLGDASLTVTHDFENRNSGIGNGYDPMAGISFTTHNFQGVLNGTGYVLGRGAAAGIGGQAQETATPGLYHLDLGTHHVGDTVSAVYTIQNTGPADATLLRGAIQTATNGAFIGNDDLSGDGMTAQNFGPIAGGSASAPYAVTLNATHAQAGTLAMLHIATNVTLGTLTAVSQQPLVFNIASTGIAITGSIQNHAALGLEQTAGGGTLSHDGLAWTLDLGTVAAGTALQALQLRPVNTAAGPADLLSGSLAVTAADIAFHLTGAAGFSGLAAGAAGDDFSLSLDTTVTGHHAQTLTLHATGSNAGGFEEALPDQTLTLRMDVIEAPPPLPVTDWNVLAADVMANYQATGQWFVTNAPPLPLPVDWDVLAAQVQANFAATGQWFL